MSDELSPIEQAIASGVEPDEPDSQPAPEPSEPDEPDTAAEELILGKFKSHDDLAKAYTELENKMRDAGAPKPEPEQEEPEDPYAFLPNHIPQERWDRVVLGLNQNPIETLVGLAQHPEYLGPQLTNGLLDEFARENPWIASQVGALLHMQQFQQPQQPSESVGDQYARQQQVRETETWADTELPDFEKYKNQIGQIIHDNRDYYAQFISDDPASQRSIVHGIYSHLLAQDYAEQRRQAMQQQSGDEPAAPTAARQTVRRSTAAPKQASKTDEIEDMIVNAKI